MSVEKKTANESPKPTVWMLFGSGGAAEVTVFHTQASLDSGRPVDSYVVVDHGPECLAGAKRAGEAAYRLVGRAGNIGKKITFGYDLKGVHNAAKISGGSGGLAMALAAFLRLDGDRVRSIGKIGATGEIVDLEMGGRIGRVEGIVKKLRCAIEILGEGDLLFYPDDNEKELPADIQATIKRKKIEAHRVTSVEQSVDILLAGNARELPKKKVTWPYRGFLAAVVVVSLIVVTFFFVRIGIKKILVSQPQAEKIIDMSAEEGGTNVSSQGGAIEKEQKPTPLEEKKVMVQQGDNPGAKTNQGVNERLKKKEESPNNKGFD